MNIKERLELIESKIDETSDNSIIDEIFNSVESWQIRKLTRETSVKGDSFLSNVKRALMFLNYEYKTINDNTKLWKLLCDGKKVIVFIIGVRKPPEIGIAQVVKHKDKELFVVKTGEKECFHGEGFYYFDQHCNDFIIEFIEP
jgi:hypothetical protein